MAVTDGLNRQSPEQRQHRQGTSRRSYGPGSHHFRLTDLDRWLEEHEYDSVRQMCGSMGRRSVPDPTAFERGNYMRVLSSYAFRSGHLNH